MTASGRGPSSRTSTRRSTGPTSKSPSQTRTTTIATWSSTACRRIRCWRSLPGRSWSTCSLAAPEPSPVGWIAHGASPPARWASSSQIRRTIGSSASRLTERTWANSANPGSGQGELNEPNGVGVDSRGHVFVADSLNDQVVEFGPDDEYIATWRGPDAGFYGPRDVAVGADDSLYILDQGHARVVKRSPGWTTSAFGSFGSGDGQVNDPTGVATVAGLVVVADPMDHRIVVFDADGQFRRAIAVPEWGKPFEYPDVLVAADGQSILASSPSTNEVLVFGLDGRRLALAAGVGAGHARRSERDGAASRRGHLRDRFPGRSGDRPHTVICRPRRSMMVMLNRTILHVDLDAFFAAVEQRDRAGAARPAGDRGRRRRRGRPRRRVGGELRGARVRRPFGDVAARGVPALPGRRLPAGRRAPVPGGQPRRDGDPAPVHAAGRADLDRRGVPRRDRVGGAVRRRPGDRPARSSTTSGPRWA